MSFVMSEILYGDKCLTYLTVVLSLYSGEQNVLYENELLIIHHLPCKEIVSNVDLSLENRKKIKLSSKS